jgi:adenylate kinase family enzyme
MIIMINGAFGSGKTTVASRLLQAIPDSMLFDPEEVGYMLRSIIPKDVMDEAENTGDFQDLELWTILTVHVARLLKGKYTKHLTVPMTIHNERYFEYIHAGFKQIDVQTHHFCLLASEETIHERLRQRGETEGNWCFQQTRKCVEAFRDPVFAEYIDTDSIPLDGVIAKIVAAL